MSTFTVQARTITLEPIENADRLELARIDGTEFSAIVQKGLHQTGDQVIYIPEQSILPDSIIEELGLIAEDGRTMLASGTVLEDGRRKRDRVKALRLRGTLSQGLVYRYTEKLGDLQPGVDYSEALQIYKWVPPVPTELSGDLEPAPGLTGYTDIENIKNYPAVLEEGEEIVAIEKAHGSLSVFALIDGQMFVSSKGASEKHMAIVGERDTHGKFKNAYWQIAERFELEAKLRLLTERFPGEPVAIFGETYGVQELMYGLQKGQLDFRAIDIRVGHGYLDFDEFVSICEELDLPTFPVLYRGAFNRDVIEDIATGREQISGREIHHREGIVVRPITERRADSLGRVILKVISWKYLAKKKDDDPEFE